MERYFECVLNRASFPPHNLHSDVYRDFEIVNPEIAVWRTSICNVQVYF